MPFQNESELLMIPGPVPVSEETRKALGSPIVAHYGKDWAEFYNETMQRLACIFQTSGDVFCIVGSGTAALETALTSCVGSGETLVILTNGFFGDRLAEIARAHGIKVKIIVSSPTVPHDPENLETVLRRARRVAAVAVVHCESSTGILNPIRDLANVVHKRDLPIIVDAVSSLGGVELPMDEWGIDVCVTASQKCLQAPPGLGIIAVAKEAWKHVINRPLSSWYFNLKVLKHYKETWGDWHPHPTTMSTPLVRALRQAVEEILKEGLKARFERHKTVSYWVRDQLKEMGFKPFIDQSVASPTLVVMEGNQKVSAAALIKQLSEQYKIKIAGGIGPTEGRVFRIGMMGFQATFECADRLVSAIKEILAGRRSLWEHEK